MQKISTSIFSTPFRSCFSSSNTPRHHSTQSDLVADSHREEQFRHLPKKFKPTKVDTFNNFMTSILNRLANQLIRPPSKAFPSLKMTFLGSASDSIAPKH